MQIVCFIIKIAFVFLPDIQLMASVILQCVVTFHLLLRMNLHKFEFLSLNGKMLCGLNKIKGLN